MSIQVEYADTLKRLHVKGSPLILFNAWDAGSALAIQDSGAKVIGTSSWAVAAAHGFGDGEILPFDLVLANLKRIIANVSIPVTIDVEGGYGKNPHEVQETILQIIEAGAAGINIEDQIIGANALYAVEDQCARIVAARKAAEQAAIPIFINARTDIFFQVDATQHNDTHVQEAIRRACSYAEAGASGFFAPGLRNLNYIKKLCASSPIPVNVMMQPHMPSPIELAAIGVSRISYGPLPYLQAMHTVQDACRRALVLQHELETKATEQDS